MDRDRKDFFVSYTSVDEEWAAWIAGVLEDAGHTVVIQAWDFRPGSNFVVEMQNALLQCERVIAVLSPAYLQARFPLSEWAAAFATDPEGAKKALIPIMVQECAPEGLLSQVVQIRIQNLGEAVARTRILEGVRPERSKPVTSPPFPGSSGTVRAPAGSGSAPTPDASTRLVSAARLRWQSPAPPVTVAWRSDLEDIDPHRVAGDPAVELHIVPVGDEARLQVRDLRDLEQLLPDHGRRQGIFSQVQALELFGDATKVRVSSADRAARAGIALTRSGQRSAWLPLPKGTLGALLDEEHLAGQLQRMIQALCAIDVPAADLVVPAVGFDPATMISYGRVGGPPSNTVMMGYAQTSRVRTAADEAIAYDALTAHPDEVAAELVARLVAEHLRATGLRRSS